MVKGGEKWRNMFLGNYQSNFDSIKGRTAIPVALRKMLGNRAIITKGYEGSLILVKTDDWHEVVESALTGNFLSSMSRQTDRYLLGNAFEVEFDSQGRFVIPFKLRDYAKLNKEILFVGVGNRVEIWDKDAWERNDQYLTENIEKISEGLGKKE